MHKFIVMLSMVIGLVVSSSMAEAQFSRSRGASNRRGGNPSDRTGGVRNGAQIDRATLVNMVNVQKEIGLEGIELKEIEDIVLKHRGKVRNLTQEAMKIRELEQKERVEAFKRFEEKVDELSAEADKVILTHLSEGQAIRLGQILLQQQGIHAFSDAAFVKKLTITEDQLTKIHQTIEDINTIRKGAGRSSNVGSMLRIRGEKTLEATLNDVQKIKLSELKGKPFDLTIPVTEQRRGSGRGSGGR